MPFADPEAKRAYQRDWCAKRRREFFDGKTCEWCPSTVDLELHHRDPNKKESHAIWSWSTARREEEIAKCIVLCSSCHTRAHSEARRVEAELRHPCGTVQAYRRGCHCAACRRANADRALEQRRAAA